MTTHLSSRLGALGLLATLVIGACSGGGATTAPVAAATANASAGAAGSAICVNGSVTAAGSTALQPLVDAAGKQYTAACPGSTIQVQGGGSGTGLTQVLQAAVQIGDSDVTAESKLKTDEAAQLVNHDVAKQGWVMVTSADVTGVTNLTSAQATDVWTGKVTNWKDLGGPDEAIVLILRPESSGTRATFKKLVLGGAQEASGQALTEDSNGAVTQAVKQTPGSTSVIGFAYYQQNRSGLNALQLDGVDASVDNMKSGTYMLAAVGHMYTKGEADGLTRAFLDYILSPDVQGTLLPSLFYAAVK
ncbi:MAG: phosphate transport system substrate-binding protein [Chloroflexota bacterium]|nr:phosphate transport system substrate-binding protein [Chloroflexota bacterium]